MLLPPKYQAAIAIVVMVAGAFIVALGALTWLHGRALDRRAVVTLAELTSVGHRESDSDTGHQVRYRFRVGERFYERVGVFGTAVGSDVSAEEQAKAIASGHLAVRYLPDNPTVNEPIAHARPQRERGLIAMGIGVMLLLAGGVRWRSVRASGS